MGKNYVSPEARAAKLEAQKRRVEAAILDALYCRKQEDEVVKPDPCPTGTPIRKERGSQPRHHLPR